MPEQFPMTGPLFKTKQPAEYELELTRLRELLGRCKEETGFAVQTMEGIYNNAMQFYEEGDRPLWAIDADIVIKDGRQLLSDIEKQLNK